MSWLFIVQWTWEYRCLFEILTSFPLGKYREVELLDHMVVQFLIFGGNCMLFCIVAAAIYIPINSAQRIPLIPSPLLVSRLLNNSHLSMCEVIPHCGFNLHFCHPDIEYLFRYLLNICIFFFFLEKCLFRFLAHLETQVIVYIGFFMSSLSIWVLLLPDL